MVEGEQQKRKRATHGGQTEVNTCLARNAQSQSDDIMVESEQQTN
jgi:hypothetical protein